MRGTKWTSVSVKISCTPRSCSANGSSLGNRRVGGLVAGRKTQRYAAEVISLGLRITHTVPQSDNAEHTADLNLIFALATASGCRVAGLYFALESPADKDSWIFNNRGEAGRFDQETIVGDYEHETPVNGRWERWDANACWELIRK